MFKFSIDYDESPARYKLPNRYSRKINLINDINIPVVITLTSAGLMKFRSKKSGVPMICHSLPNNTLGWHYR